MMDRLALRTAAASVKAVPDWMRHADDARRLLDQSDFFATDLPAAEVTFTTGGSFRFNSPLPLQWPENNTVHGRFFRAGRTWTKAPTVVLLHGWNAALAYRTLFPWLAWRCARSGLNAAMLELPFHLHRQPAATRLNFLSGDLWRLLQATRQSVADIRALIRWLANETEGAVGCWGFSLGAWLAGFVACYELRNQFSVMATPVVHMERAIRELPFCRPIRSSCEEANLWPRAMNLVEHRPCISPRRILLVEAVHDLFAPAETIETLWETWARPVIWRVPHGHISILMAVPILERMIRWMAQTAREAGRPAPR